GFPVAESGAARQRFQVTSYRFHRQLNFYQGDRLLATIYLGGSPGYRRVYARNERQDAIFSLQYNNHDAPVSTGAWLDPQLAQIAQPVALTVDGLALQRDIDGQWRTRAGAQVNTQALDTLVKTLASIRVTGVAGEEMQGKLRAEARVQRSIDIDTLSGQTIQLALLQYGKGFYLRDSRYPPLFQLAPHQYLRLLGVDGEALTAPGPSAPAPSEAVPGAPGLTALE
ncbi:MAG: DUF4340 domain-containing protein, partial [Parahaliea sp.]